MVQPVEKDPFAMGALDLTMIPKPTREITFALLADNKSDALTPRDIEEQFKNLERLIREGRWVISQWDRQADPYFRILGRIENLIREVNRRTKDIRVDAARAARDNRHKATEDRGRSIKFGVERKVG